MTRQDEMREWQAQMVDRLNQNLIEVATWEERLGRARRRYFYDQQRQLHFDRAQREIDAQRKRFRQLKEELLQIEI